MNAHKQNWFWLWVPHAPKYRYIYIVQFQAILIVNDAIHIRIPVNNVRGLVQNKRGEPKVRSKSPNEKRINIKTNKIIKYQFLCWFNEC